MTNWIPLIFVFSHSSFRVPRSSFLVNLCQQFSADILALRERVRAEFIAYGFNREGREGNILYKKPSFA